MASFTQRSTTVTRHEWAIPATPGLGVPIGEFSKAYADARSAYLAAHGMSQVPDDGLWVTAGDDELVISYETSRTA
jgi:hypothetical protein